MEGKPRQAAIEYHARRLVMRLDALFPRLFQKYQKEEWESVLSHQEMRAIAVLKSIGCSIMSDFADAMGAPLSTASHMIERLVKKGMVERLRTEKDRRVVHVELSAEGKKRERLFLDQRLAMAREMLAPLSPGEREIFMELLGKMIQSANPKAAQLLEDTEH
jgi:DNA-binding MarR family transcriptional regulator